MVSLLDQRTSTVVSHCFVVVGDRVHDVLLSLTAISQIGRVVVACAWNERLLLLLLLLLLEVELGGFDHSNTVWCGGIWRTVGGLKRGIIGVHEPIGTIAGGNIHVLALRR